MQDKSKQVEILIDKAAKESSPDAALKFSQAACNAANAMMTVENYLALTRTATTAQ